MLTIRDFIFPLCPSVRYEEISSVSSISRNIIFKRKNRVIYELIKRIVVFNYFFKFQMKRKGIVIIVVTVL